MMGYHKCITKGKGFNMYVTTREQREALRELWLKRGQKKTYMQFRRDCLWGMFGSYIGVEIGKYFYGIEKDGHTHT
tara:strand:+ start:90 stop:317 length:228 start_codon:yes stop_codon:yes gene_type:complete